jgi:flagellar biosynthesis component FlhA
VEPVWIMNTAPLPAMGRGYTVVEPIWLMNTILLPVVKLPAQKKES